MLSVLLNKSFPSFVVQELECLQTMYDELRPDCKQVVGNITEEEDEDLELDNILMKACTPMIKKFCNVRIHRA